MEEASIALIFTFYVIFTIQIHKPLPGPVILVLGSLVAFVSGSVLYLFLDLVLETLL